MSKILLSIKPEYVEKILSGEKQFEYRKRVAYEVTTIFIYSSSPEKMIVGEVDVVNTISASPSAIWENTKENAGISRKKFRLYFKGCKTAYAYCLGTVRKYETPIDLNDMHIASAPQSFIYISKDKR